MFTKFVHELRNSQMESKEFVSVSDTILFFVVQLGNSHHHGEMADTPIQETLLTLLDTIIPYFGVYKNSPLLRHYTLGALRAIYFFSRDVALTRSLTKENLDQLKASLKALLSHVN